MPDRDAEMKQQLDRAGIDAATVDAALELDAILQRWRRRLVKRELGLRALRDLGLPMEMPQLDALLAIWAPAADYGEEAGGEVMVSTVAARLNVDPSRASRITADLIRLGLVRRAVSQVDGRRSVLAVTEAGERVVRAVRMYKFLTLGPFLSDWSAAELAAFIPLLDRFSAWSDTPADPSGRIAREIAALRADLPDLDP